MIDIISVGDQKLQYPNHENIEFSSLSFYLNLAQKTIAKFGGSFSSNIRQEMLNSEDAVSHVANCLMMADWRWDKERKGLSGQQKTQYSYRNQCAIWAIKSYVGRKKNHKTLKMTDAYANNNKTGDEDLSILDLSHKNNDNPSDIIMNQEEEILLKKYLDAILDAEANILTNKQIEYIKLYFFESMTFAEIGKRFSITREAVRQGIKKAIEKIRKVAIDV